MKKVIYYVASSLDGYIAGLNDDISKFIFQGKGIEKYQTDLLKFKTVIMGRKTYEFGYQYGLKPGQPAYQHMNHHIFSNTLKIDNLSKQVKIETIDIEKVNEIKNNSETDIYLCGGGQFAGWLLDNGLIDQLILKLNPIILGEGVSLFGKSKTINTFDLINKESYDEGLITLTYNLKKQNTN